MLGINLWMNIIFSILAFSNADLRSEFECIAVFDRSHMVFSMHIILGSVKLNLKLHTRKSKHTHIQNAPIGKEAYACVYIIELELKSIPIISTYYIYNYELGLRRIAHYSPLECARWVNSKFIMIIT